MNLERRKVHVVPRSAVFCPFPTRLTLPQFLGLHFTCFTRDEIAMFAIALHLIIKYQGGQTRESGEPFYEHLLVVAEMLYNMSFEPEVIISGLLHDFLEDVKDVKRAMFEKEFTPKICRIVSAMTKKKGSNYFKQLLDAATCDFEVLFVKMCDRLHNLLTVDGLAICRRTRFINETLGEFRKLLIRGQEFIPLDKQEKYENLSDLIRQTAIEAKAQLENPAQPNPHPVI